MMRYIFKFFVYMIPIFLIGEVNAADIKLIKHDKTHSYFISQIELELTGEITEGDTERLIQILESDGIKHKPSAVLTAKIFLNSKGGSYAEGVKLMRAFKQHTVSTFVRNEDTCFSACAIAFLGGTFVNEASIGEVRRTVQPLGKLGFHAPSLGLASDTMVPASLMEQSYALALKAIGSIQSAEKSFDIKPTLLQTIISTPPKEMYILKHVDDFARWNITVEFNHKGWQPTKQDVARWCMHYTLWREGTKLIVQEKSINKEANIDPKDPNRWTKKGVIDDWVKAMKIYDPKDKGRVRSIFAYVLTDEYNGGHCIVELKTFGNKGTFYGVHKTTSSPKAAIENIRTSNVNPYWATRFHALPPDFEISRLAK